MPSQVILVLHSQPAQSHSLMNSKLIQIALSKADADQQTSGTVKAN